MKVTIVTPVLNNAGFIEGCIASVAAQNYRDLEHIIIDGGSTDGTLSILERCNIKVFRVSETGDKGMYDALNFGIKIAKGALIGVLGADDRLADPEVIASIVCCFRRYSCDAVYGHLDFVSRYNSSRVTRRWKSRSHVRACLELGWMPPHPALYVKKTVLPADISYPLNYGTSGDYDFILNLLYKKKINAVFLDRRLVYMLAGGVSNRWSMNLIRAVINDYRILVRNGMPKPLLTVFLKKLRKLTQLI